MRFSYLGPRGTFTHMALMQISSDEGGHIPAIDVPAALRMVRNEETDFAGRSDREFRRGRGQRHNRSAIQR